jgi:hypothetical protein
MTCRCGRPTIPDDTLCARCRYYANVFNPPVPVFESRREKALKAITMKRMMKNSSKIMVVE